MGKKEDKRVLPDAEDRKG